MGAWLIELISNIVDITGNALVDTIIFAVIGFVSGSIAFGLVGLVSNATRNYNSKSMSELHWGIRVILFVLITYVLVLIAKAIKWMITPPRLYFLIGIVAIIIICILYKIFKKSGDDKNNEAIEIDNEKPIIEEVKPNKLIKNDIKLCPYCGGLLVERQGPYGVFLGCSGYPKCKYTRKE